MIDCNSNCCRVDAVKALADQLKMQTLTKNLLADKADASKRLKGDLAELDAQIKSGDAKKAENALAAVKREISANAHDSQAGSQGGISDGDAEFRRFFAYA